MLGYSPRTKPVADNPGVDLLFTGSRPGSLLNEVRVLQMLIW